MVFAMLRQCAPHLIHAFLSPYPSTNPKRHLDRFSRFCTARGRESLYFTTGRPVLNPHLIACMLPWPIRVRNTNGISSGSGLTTVIDRPTDATPSVTTDRIYVRTTAMWPKNEDNTSENTQSELDNLNNHISLLTTYLFTYSLLPKSCSQWDSALRR